jgi:hypothetical protein
MSKIDNVGRTAARRDARDSALECPILVIGNNRQGLRSWANHYAPPGDHPLAANQGKKNVEIMLYSLETDLIIGQLSEDLLSETPRLPTEMCLCSIVKE